MPRTSSLIAAVVASLVTCGAIAAVDGVSVQLSDSQPRELDLVTGERFSVGATATLLCATGSVNTRLGYHVLRQEALGHAFDTDSIFDYDAIKRRGRVLERSLSQELVCNRPTQVLHAGLRAPPRSGTYYLSVCFPALPRDGASWWPNAGPGGNPSNCTHPVTLKVGARPAPDLIIRDAGIEPGAGEYDAGQEVRLRAVVRNAGNGSAPETRLRFVRVSQPDDWGSAGLTLATQPVPALAPGEEVAVSARTTAPSLGGTYYVEACVTPAGRGSDDSAGDGSAGPEAFIDNNCSAALTLRVGRSDLPPVRIASLLVAGGEVQARQNVQTRATIASGGGDEPFVGELVLLQRETAADPPHLPAGDDDYTERARDSVRVEPGETLSRGASVSAPQRAGRYQLVACLAREGLRFGCSDPVEISVR